MGQDNQSPEVFGQTPWQTVGPFFHYGLPWKGGADLIGDSDLGARTDLMPPEHYILGEPRPRGPIPGQAILITGQVFDAAGAPVPDALIEIWQPNAAGRFNSPADGRDEIPLDADFIGFGRSATSDDGRFRFRTIIPGPVPGHGNSLQAPHIAVGVFGRGLIKRLVTRLYFAGDARNDADPILALVPPDRRPTLLAVAASEEEGVWRFDIRLAGDHETVFFDC
jgi:protocatechuate 3,4-dioxygenase alpha subunit